MQERNSTMKWKGLIRVLIVFSYKGMWWEGDMLNRTAEGLVLEEDSTCG